MVEQVTCWVARDGSYHRSEAKALDHNDTVVIKKDVKEFVRMAFGYLPEIENLAISRTIFRNRLPLIKILSGGGNGPA